MKCRLKSRMTSCWWGKRRKGIIVRTSLPEFATEIEREKARAEGFAIAGGLSHKTPDYPTLLAKGLRGILIEIRRKKRKSPSRPDSPEKAEKLLFMEAMEIECQAVIDLAHRYARTGRANGSHFQCRKG
jgi:hypothetical protein